MTERPTLLLLPGLLNDARLWAHQLEHLCDIADVRVPDLTGHASMEELARAVLADAPPRFALVGLSMGGYVAQEIMRQAPDRVTHLALLDTNARADSDEQKRRRQCLIALSRKGEFRGVTPRLLPMLIHPERLDDTALTNTIMTMAERVGQQAFVNQQTAIMNRADSRPDLAHIRIPALIIGGRQDSITPPDIIKEIADGIPDARLSIIEDCGHLSPLERPQAVTALLHDFLAYH